MEQNKGLNFPDGLRIDKRWLRALMNSFLQLPDYHDYLQHFYQHFLLTDLFMLQIYLIELLV